MCSIPFLSRDCKVLCCICGGNNLESNTRKVRTHIYWNNQNTYNPHRCLPKVLFLQLFLLFHFHVYQYGLVSRWELFLEKVFILLRSFVIRRINVSLFCRVKRTDFGVWVDHKFVVSYNVHGQVNGQCSWLAVISAI